MGGDFVIGCVGKPSAGKSTFFNAATDGKAAKVGAYNVQCKPRFGFCVNGKRFIPVKMLDVAGLIPGASEVRSSTKHRYAYSTATKFQSPSPWESDYNEITTDLCVGAVKSTRWFVQGLGLGNKFLDDLRHAEVLLHILDISGTTNEKGEACEGYDPIKDHTWLLQEIELWVYNNLWSKWNVIARRHTAKKSSVVTSLLGQLSGYGANERCVRQTLEELTGKSVFSTNEAEDLALWDKEKVRQLATAFVKTRFQFILVLNKADVAGDTDRNVIRITETFDPNRIVLASALSECFLKKCREQKRIAYEDGAMGIILKEDGGSEAENLLLADERTKQRLDRVKDMVLYRLGSTGVRRAIQKAVEVAELFPVYPVRNITHFGAKNNQTSGAFSECLLVKKGTTVMQLAEQLHHEIARNFISAEGADGQQLSQDDILTPEKNVIRIITSAVDAAGS